MVEWEMPSAVDNESFIRWFGRLQRLSGSPKDFVKQIESVFVLDPGDAPERIATRTLVMHVKGDRVLPVAGGRLLADLIPDAHVRRGRRQGPLRLEHAELARARRHLDRVRDGRSGRRTSARRFATVLFTDIVDSTVSPPSAAMSAWRELLDSHDRIARGLVDEHGGRLIKSTGDGLLAIFDLPSQAVGCTASSSMHWPASGSRSAPAPTPGRSRCTTTATSPASPSTSRPGRAARPRTESSGHPRRSAT